MPIVCHCGVRFTFFRLNFNVYACTTGVIYSIGQMENIASLSCTTTFILVNHIRIVFPFIPTSKYIVLLRFEKFLFRYFSEKKTNKIRIPRGMRFALMNAIQYTEMYFISRVYRIYYDLKLYLSLNSLEDIVWNSSIYGNQRMLKEYTRN